MPVKIKIFFETNLKNNKFAAGHLSLNPIYRTDYKGFMYLTDEHNDAYSIKIYCNPKRLYAGGFDKIDISVEVLDILSNPVIGKEVAMDCISGILKYDDKVTDVNGVIHFIYQSSFLPSTDIITASVITDDMKTITESITVINEKKKED